MTPSDYLTLYSACRLTTDVVQLKILDHIADRSLTYRDTYLEVAKRSGIPWFTIAAIHFRESDQNFKCHLHNGDSLTSRTIHVPRNRPLNGQPPFTWQESACDALSEVWTPDAWDIAGCLEFMERYNGLGYQKHGINSPYVWDYTNAYDSGLFITDGKFDPDKKESRPGCVSILKTLTAKGVALDFTPNDGDLVSH